MWINAGLDSVQVVRCCPVSDIVLYDRLGGLICGPFLQLYIINALGLYFAFKAILMLHVCILS
mgnify:CR=1 FL=1